ncbi:MAG: methyltransferase domain-containing protein, partial [Oscillospiraceae bacterium]|nr:methyltransferase domain-containing protein [Oscillospiraceae bacterium]
IRYSHPLPLLRLMEGELPLEELERWLQCNNQPAELTVQVNTLKTDVDALARSLADSGAEVTAHPWMPDCLLVKGSGDLERLAAFQAGECYIQDSAAKLAALLSDVQPGDRVLDACAAPGGKSFAAAIQMENRGEILSCDIQEKKLTRIQSGANRLGLDIIRTQAADARQFRPEWQNSFDAVLADVPCSGLGIIRKKPDIRDKDVEELACLPKIQLDILCNAARYVRPGGVLLYSTCTVLSRENGAVVGAFLDKNADFALEPFSMPGEMGTCGGMITLWPQTHGCDGFFIAKLRRRNG